MKRLYINGEHMEGHTADRVEVHPDAIIGYNGRSETFALRGVHFGHFTWELRDDEGNVVEVPPQPDTDGFRAGLLDLLGDDRSNALLRSYPLVKEAITYRKWPLAWRVFGKMVDDEAITQREQLDIEALADQHHIPPPEGN